MIGLLVLKLFLLSYSCFIFFIACLQELKKKPVLSAILQNSEVSVGCPKLGHTTLIDYGEQQSSLWEAWEICSGLLVKYDFYLLNESLLDNVLVKIKVLNNV